ncbi:DUF4373 domain-containing protein [Bacillus infantis]|nr:DUF4373 domain-containing protein [Bacillus infantis]
MARPIKQGLDYFPLDVHLDDKFKFIEIKYKLEGFAVVIKLLQKIYSSGYWCKWTEDEALLFSDDLRTNVDLVNAVVNECLSREVFDKNLYEKHKILTSRGIQKRYKEIASRRKHVEVIKEYLVIDGINGINDNINKVNDNIMSSVCKQDEDNSTQSKVKESKEKETNKYIHDLYEHYNSKNIIKHQKLTDSMKRSAKAMLRDYTFETLKKAIDNYAEVLASENHYFSHKFPFADFMRDKDIRKFVDEAEPLINFAARKPKNHPVIQAIQPDSRDKEIEFQRWVQAGNDPAEFNWQL